MGWIWDLDGFGWILVKWNGFGFGWIWMFVPLFYSKSSLRFCCQLNFWVEVSYISPEETKKTGGAVAQPTFLSGTSEVRCFC